MKKLWSHSLHTAMLAVLAVGSATGCGLFGGDKSASSDVTYDITSSASGLKAKVIYLKKIPPDGTTPDVVNGDQYVGVEVVELPWKKQLTLDGSTAAAYVGVALDASEMKIDPANPSVPAALSATFTCTITADGKRIDQQQNKAGAICSGPEAKDKLKNLGKH